MFSFAVLPPEKTIVSISPPEQISSGGHLTFSILSGLGISSHNRLYSASIVNNILRSFSNTYLNTISRNSLLTLRDMSCSLTHWGQVTHISVSKLSIFVSDNGLMPGWCQAIIWTNAGIMFNQNLGTNFSEILSEILIFLSKKSWKCRLENGGHFVLASMR